jgi:ADP-ribose pyrophosphatase YjhB (NUDIX family)
MPSVEKILPHIATIHDLDNTTDTPSTSEVPVAIALAGWTIRLAARCIVVDPQTSRIALQSLDTEGVTKIPGGGLQYQSESSIEGEGFGSGISREIGEEIGVDASKMSFQPLGIVTEYRRQWQLQQFSYCYVGEIGEGERYQEPTEEGSHLVWADTPAHALELVNGYDTDTYDKTFMRLRDIAILEYYKSTLAAV